MEDLGFGNEVLDDESEELSVIAKTIVRYEKLNQNRPRIMVITNSDRPVTIAVGGHKDVEEYSFSVSVASITSNKLLDSNGAGDTFVGGFLARLCQIAK